MTVYIGNMTPTGEHISDVLASALTWQAHGDAVALAVITATEGGAVRAPGAMMAISESGAKCGYVSGGCIDSDVALRAQAALKGGETRLRYGAGSPFMDIRLPCGGAIELEIIAQPDTALLTRAVEQLARREPIYLATRDGQLIDATAMDNDAFSYRPHMRLRIAGRGEDAIALVRLARSSGFETELWSPDAECLDKALDIGGVVTWRLSTPGEMPQPRDDRHTAIVLMFHDEDWEVPLLKRALKYDAFYIGAVGSRSTHAKRCEALLAAGASENDIARVRGPIGLVPSMRDASMLAVSTLAEIVREFHQEAAA